jgi:hypothetical protein
MKPCNLGLDTLLEMDGNIIDQEMSLEAPMTYWPIFSWKLIVR